MDFNICKKCKHDLRIVIVYDLNEKSGTVYCHCLFNKQAESLFTCLKYNLDNDEINLINKYKKFIRTESFLIIYNFTQHNIEIEPTNQLIEFNQNEKDLLINKIYNNFYKINVNDSCKYYLEQELFNFNRKNNE